MKYDTLMAQLESSITGIDGPDYDEIRAAVEARLRRLYNEGKIQLGSDPNLTNGALEVRVEEVFKKMGFQIGPGREKHLEDFIVTPSDECEPQFPLVVEVKSSTKPRVSRADLRQLDDWVFELSGEETLRKRRARQGKGNVFYITAGLPPGPDTHPTPHKGIMVFNGPLGVAFNQRNTHCINTNDLDYVEKRFFCIIPFHELIRASSQAMQGRLLRGDVWEQMHECAGVLEFK